MKAIFIALLALCVCVVGAADKKTGVERAGYKGRVKSMKVSSFAIEEKFGKPVRASGGVNNVTKYDKKGNNVEGVTWADGKITKKYTAKYDEKGNMVEEVHYDAIEKIEERFTYKYDEKGNRVERVKYDANGKLENKDTYKYDKKGNRIKETRYEPKTGFGETRFIPTKEQSWEFTYWN